MPPIQQPHISYLKRSAAILMGMWLGSASTVVCSYLPVYSWDRLLTFRIWPYLFETHGWEFGVAAAIVAVGVLLSAMIVVFRVEDRVGRAGLVAFVALSLPALMAYVWFACLWRYT